MESGEQLTIASCDERPIAIDPLERIGDSEAFEQVLIRILEQNGWTVDPLTAFGGGPMWILNRGSYELGGESITELFLEAGRLLGLEAEAA